MEELLFTHAVKLDTYDTTTNQPCKVEALELDVKWCIDSGGEESWWFAAGHDWWPCSPGLVYQIEDGLTELDKEEIETARQQARAGRNIYFQERAADLRRGE